MVPAMSAPVLTPEAADRHAAAIRLAGPSLAEQHQRIARYEQQTLEHIYGGALVTETGLLEHMACRNLGFDHRADPLRVSNEQLAMLLTTAKGRLVEFLVRSLPCGRVPYLMRLPGVAEVILCHCPRFFTWMPAAMKTAERLKPILETIKERKKDELIWEATKDNPHMARELETLEERVRRNPASFAYVPDEALTPRLCRLAIAQEPCFLSRLCKLVDTHEYEQLCDLALENSGEALRYIAPPLRTAARVDRALAHKKPPEITAIPVHLHTRERLEKALLNDSFPYHEAPSCQFLSDWGLWDAFRTQTDWLSRIKKSERTDERYAAFVTDYPARLATVPLSFMKRWDPQWLSALFRTDVYLRMDEHNWPALPCQRREAPELESLVYKHFVVANPLCQVPPALLKELPAWAVMLAPWRDQLCCLGETYKEMILKNGGGEGLGETLGAAPFHLEKEALLDPMQETHCTRRSAWLPAQICKKLFFCHRFRLPHREAGMALRDQMDQHRLAIAGQVVSRTLLSLRPDRAAGWQVRGGRTLVREENGRCVHMKFKRRGESLATFAAEEAVQRFALAHQKILGLRSEIPEPRGIFWVRPENLPTAAREFADPLDVMDDPPGPGGYLVFCFSTKDHDYDTLAWQADGEQADGGRAREGLMRAFHDLGVWSSLGVMHTSTIRLYHHFYSEDDLRPELVLRALFSAEQAYPGALHLWNTKAIERSDWGWSGLRDLGDLEFYPFISCYVESGEAQWAPPGYAQRASFVNALAHNLLGGLLHFMRQQREQPAYHYRNPEAVETMARCVEDAFDNVLHGLLRDGTRLKTLFPDEETYGKWLPLTAREIVYWTAQQNPQENKDCFACHFEENGRPSAELYPGHPALSCRYGEHFTEEEGETLGTNNGKFPLFYLVRGLYVMAGGLADRLGTPEQAQQEQEKS